MTEEFVLTITEHRIFGKVLTANSIDISNNKYYPITNIITQSSNSALTINHAEKELVKLIDEYSDRTIAKLFSKKKLPAKIFIDTLSKDIFENHIRNYIEKRIAKCISIAIKENINIYLKNNQRQLYKEDKIEVFHSPAEALFNFERIDQGTNYFLTLKQNDKEIKLNGKIAKILTIEPCNLILNKKLYSFTNIDAKKLLPFFEKKHITIKKEAEKRYYESFILNAIKKYTVITKGFEIIDLKPKKQAILSLEKNLKNEAILLLKFEYGNEKTFLINESNNLFVKLKFDDTNIVFHKIYRDSIWEQDCILKLEKIGLKKDIECNFTTSNLPSDIESKQHNFINWLNTNKSNLEKAGFILVQEFLNKKYFTQEIHLDLKVKDKNDWFDIYANVHFGEFTIPFIRLRNHILNDIREFKLPNDEIAVLPEEWFSEYKDLFLFSQNGGENFVLKKHHFQLIKNKPIGISPTLKDTFTALVQNNSTNCVLPDNLKAELRPYQKSGYHWLYKLHANNFGGCLADDMGLGKTLQTISLLQQLINEKKNITNNIPEQAQNTQLSIFDAINELEKDFCKPTTQSAASLIVMPTSLIHNWFNEIRKFAPNLTILKYTGTDRKKYSPASFFNYDLVLTSYGVVRNDFEILSNYHYFYIILDESQYIKNPDSKTYKAITSLNSSHKLVLTGTPIENSLTDLWSQLNFLNEGILGNLPFFKTHFVTPIEKNQDENQQKKLQTLIQPFILRRTKDEVATDLPALTSQEIYCEMTEEQSSFYESEKSKVRNAILESIEEDKPNNISFMILQGLMKLRQAANHPKLANEEYSFESGKFNEISRTIENLIAQNHKVLVFSSFVEHLRLLAKLFKKRNWKYCKLTGRSTKREEIIKEFQENEDIRLFLISLKAGGVGLNLTSADYVFIIDPWWNPAAESQAISRAHRIGQDKKVFVYRFITKNSIEEKIQALQRQKSELAKVFVNSNNPFKKLDQETLIELFK